MDFDTRRPFTRADAIAAGIDPKLLRGSRFRRLFRGVHIDSSVSVDLEIRTTGALLCFAPSAFASHHTAAQLLRLPVPEAGHLHVSVVDRAHRRDREGIQCHLAAPSHRVTRRRGIRLSSPLEIFCELASSLSLVDLVVLGDAMLKQQLITRTALTLGVSSRVGRHTRAAQRAAALVRDGVDSPMETRLRLLILFAGLPEPVVNHLLRDEFGQVRRRLDLSYPEIKLIIEYDGRHHIARKSQWESDLERREEFDRDGWRILVVTSSGIYRQPDRTVERIHAALSDRGVRSAPTDGWQVHFSIR